MEQLQSAWNNKYFIQILNKHIFKYNKSSDLPQDT